MRALLQRVRSASVTVDGAVVSSINDGLLVYLGVGRHDTAADATWIASKLAAARLWDDGGKQWALSLATSPLRRVLIVSQFTLHGGLSKPKPSFHRSAGGGEARVLFDAAVEALRSALGAERVETGVFGAMMDVASINAGPMTLWLDSHNRADTLWEERGEAPSPAAAATASAPTAAAELAS